jgi:hypothetical protein
MKGGGDPDNRRDFPGGFGGDARSAFIAAGRSAEEQSVFEHVRKVARLRGALEPLRRGTLINLWVSDQQYAYARQTPRQTAMVVINNDTRDAQMEFDVTALGLADDGMAADRLGSQASARVTNGLVRTTIGARSAAVFSFQSLR